MIRNPIHIITNADLEQNGGRWKLQGGAVIPVDHSTLVVASAAGDKLVAGSITPVYFVTAAQLATPRFKLMGGSKDNHRLYTGIVSRGIKGGAAIPVYDPNFIGSHSDKVLGYNPIAYFIMGEPSGATAIDQVNSPAQDGAYTGVTLGQEGIGDGNTCPLFDGINAYNNIYTATLRDAFNPAEGTLMVWAKVSAAGVWTDGFLRYASLLLADPDNRIGLYKHSDNNTLGWFYEANNTLLSVLKADATTTGWFSMGITWSVADDSVNYYYNGSASGLAADPGLGVWVGDLAATTTIIGAGITTPVSVWDGYEAHGSLFGSALSAAVMADLAVI